MIRIIDGRGTGKTSRLMLLAKENNALFVCNDPHAMQYKAERYGITGLTFFRYTDFLNLNYEENVFTTVVVDEIDNLLQLVVRPLRLVGYTISADD